MGRIKLDCANCGIYTDWRPSCLASTSSSTCTNSKPVSAPVLLSATAGTNTVTLNWSKVPDPVSGYLIVYGDNPSNMEFSNPNINNVTSYTINNLSSGKTYYFQIKALNGCMPGDSSNIISATTGGAASNPSEEK